MVSVRWLSRQICLHIVYSCFVAVGQNHKWPTKPQILALLLLSLLIPGVKQHHSHVWCLMLSSQGLSASVRPAQDSSQGGLGLPRGWEQKLQGSEIKLFRNQMSVPPQPDLGDGSGGWNPFWWEEQHPHHHEPHTEGWKSCHHQ